MIGLVRLVSSYFSRLIFFRALAFSVISLIYLAFYTNSSCGLLRAFKFNRAPLIGRILICS
jgi:hypothetical protein